MVEAIIPEDGRPSPNALMDMNMLALMPGRERTLRELRDLFAAADLEVERVSQTRSAFDIIELAAP